MNYLLITHSYYVWNLWKKMVSSEKTNYFLMSSSNIASIYRNAIRNSVWWRGKKVKRKSDRDMLLKKMKKGDKIIFFNTPEKEFCYICKVREKPNEFKNYPKEFREKLPEELGIEKNNIVIHLSSKKEKVSLFLDKKHFEELKKLDVFKNVKKYEKCGQSFQGYPRREIGKKAFTYINKNIKERSEVRIVTRPKKEQPVETFKRFLQVLRHFLVSYYFVHPFDYVASEEKRVQFLLIEQLVDSFDSRLSDAKPENYHVSWEDEEIDSKKVRYDIVIYRSAISDKIAVAAEIKVIDTGNPVVFLERIVKNKMWSFQKDVDKLHKALKDRKISNGVSIAFTNIDFKKSENRNTVLKELTKLFQRYSKVNIMVVGLNSYLCLLNGKEVSILNCD